MAAECGCLMGRRPPEVTGNGHSSIPWPGVYQHVLQRVCEEQAGDHYAALTDCDLAQVERENAAAVAACVRERSGEPVHGLSHHLPDGMSPPFHQPFPGFGISVTPDDRVTRRPRTAPSGRCAAR